MKKLISLLLICVLALGVLSGCQKTESPVGTWNTQIDLNKTIQDLLKTEAVDTDLNVDAQMIFEEDGAFSFQLDKKDFNKALDSFVDSMKPSALKDLEKSLKGNGISDMLSQFGVDTSAITGGFDLDSLMDKLAENVAISGYYKVTGTHLFLFPEKDSKLPNAYIVFNVTGDTLTLEKHIGTNPFAMANLLFRSLPMTFTKA